MRLGEILIQRGVINESQLKSALDAQLIYGAHLGTCLIELGYVDEEVLGTTLADIFGVNYARRELFENIPPEIIESLPAKVVENQYAIPFAMSANILQVAMTDPKNYQALDVVSFAAGHRVQAWVAPEVRIFQAMERYYEVPRRLRYIALCARLDEKKKPKPAQAVMTAAQGGVQATAQPRAKSQPKEQLPTREPAQTTAQTPTRAQTQTSTPSRAATGEPLTPILVPLVGLSSPTPSASAGRADAAASRHQEPRDPLAGLTDEICNADSVWDLSAVVMGHLSQGLSRCILFKVKSGAATVWDSRGIPLGPAELAKLSLQVGSEPLFRLLCGESYFKGPLPGPSVSPGFYKMLQIEPPSELIIVPGYVNDALVTLFYGDVVPPATIQRPADEFRRLTHKTAIALQVIALRRAIRAT